MQPAATAAVLLLILFGLEIGAASKSDWELTMKGVHRRNGALALRALSHTGSADNLLHLTFDTPVPMILKDAAGNYRIRRSSYIFSGDGKVGKGSALFNRPENRIIVDSPEELWPGSGPLGDFSLEMWLKPVHFAPRALVFRKTGLQSSLELGLRTGMEIYIQDRMLHFTAHNLFRDAKARPRTIQLRSRTALRGNHWTHVLVSYRESDGKLVLYLNGREERVRFAADGRGIWKAGFGRLDRSPLVIGESYFGQIDEFRIARRFYEGSGRIASSAYSPLKYDYIHDTGNQKIGSVQSNVFMIPNRGLTRSARLGYDARTPAGSAVKLWIRYSTRPFQADTPAAMLPWKFVYRTAKNIPAFSFFQYKAELRADPAGGKTPELRNVALHWTPYQAPVRPRAIRVIAGESREEKTCHLSEQVCLEWFQNPESAVRAEGGYYVYYGPRSGEYTGRLTVRADAMGKLVPIRYRRELPLTREEERMRRIRPRAFKRRVRGRVRLKVTNALIERNMVRSMRRAARNPSPGKRMPFLRNNRTYYFAVAAYYRVAVKTPDGRTEYRVMESPMSREAVAVPRPIADL